MNWLFKKGVFVCLLIWFYGCKCF